MRTCECGCGRTFEKGRNWNGVQRRFYERKCKERAYWSRGEQHKIKPRKPRAGRCTQQVVDVRCPDCQTKVETGTDALTGRTWQACRCGVQFIGRWREAA